ncbi:hypothetical protein G5B30_12645 [Sphingobacterium sp. SGG-5]|uniref:hypothetical protein n=1 Tax=Sphingobacterium sp. SGG-5 TaxID=2710881 RepID=UPI0013EADD1F|nr:hypothetical protein [Sphingobacterium sp. SGG-5]NGM62762.1 hypothetical protein [Sphingobacterium sp. SGG-5]
MKQYIYFICFLFILSALRLNGQGLPGIGIGAGYQMPVTKESLSPAFGTQLHFYYPFFKKGNFSLGSAIGGDYAFSEGASPFSRSGFAVDEKFSSSLFESSNSSSGQSNYGWRIGPQANFQAGKFLLSGILQTGQSYWKQADYRLEQEISGAAGAPVRKEIYAREEVRSSSWLVSPRLRIAYPLSDRIQIWTEGSLITSQMKVKERALGLPEGTVINGETYGNFVESKSIDRETEENWNISTVQLGLNFQLGKTKRPKVAKSKNPLYEGEQKGDNPLFESKKLKSDENPDRKRILTAVLPKNNARFSQEKPVKELRWQLLGNKIPSPKYIVELQRVDAQGRPAQSYHTTSEALSVSIVQMAKGALPDGMYRWQVREASTGLASGPQFFSVGNCDIQFRIENDTITCMGYEGENRKYRICFNSVYSSTSGDLTYAQPGSGLNLFDQGYNALSYTLVAPNTTLQTQLGSTSSSVQYCVEVLVPPSVTSIGIGLQGDDLDPSPILCQPGVALSLDSLPECICKECDELTMDLQNMQITPYNGQGNQFQFAGDLVANHPLYAVEVQVLSFAYSAQPTPCSSGVSILEESGMILRPGTTINSSTALQFMNSTANPNANGNAAKVIKYQAGSAMTGNIPVNVIVGLPGPLAGFDASCCRLNYEVCFRVVVYYDENTCKSCVFTKCFQFDNQ